MYVTPNALSYDSDTEVYLKQSTEFIFLAKFYVNISK